MPNRPYLGRTVDDTIAMYKPHVSGTEGAVSSNSPYATQAGLEIMKQGGKPLMQQLQCLLFSALWNRTIVELAADASIHSMIKRQMSSTAWMPGELLRRMHTRI